jgi:pyridoxamine 5'-phosphate oxidase
MKTTMSKHTLLTPEDPFDLLRNWLREAAIAEPGNADAAQLATVDDKGMPNIRTVLIREWSENGFIFYTNYQSAKGRELLSTPKGALLYYWKSIGRQVRIRGSVVLVDDETADVYFASRPRRSQLAAHASRQSRPMTDRDVLEKRIEMLEKRFTGVPVPRPPHWSGFRLVPVSIEFWQERPFRLHDRLEFRLRGKVWRSRLLYP